MYRVLIIFTTLLPRLQQKYAMLDSLLVTFLLIHAITHPYQYHLHNIIDGLLIFNLLFFNLIAINKITTLNYNYSKASTEDIDWLTFTTSITVILLNIPLFCMIRYISRKVICKVQAVVLKTSPLLNDTKGHNDFELSTRNEESDSEDSCDYQAFGNAPHLS